MSVRCRMGILLAVCGSILLGCAGGGDDTGSDRSVGPLEPRKPFPSVELLTLDGKPVDSASLVASRDAIVFFVSLGCESCEELLEVWRPRLDTVPEDIALLAIADEEPAFAREFARTRNFPLPLYCDEQGIFSERHGIKVYPTVVGITSGGTIAYVGQAVTPVFTPEKALELLADVKTRRGEP